MKKKYEKPEILSDEISVSTIMASESPDYMTACGDADFQHDCKGCNPTNSWCTVEKATKVHPNTPASQPMSA
jgi:hypothetical protein